MSAALTALIVDDDEHLRGLLTLGVEDLGYAAHAAENTLKAREWLASRVPDLILLDIMMPDGNGLDFCRWLKQQPRLAGVPIIVSSALKDEETVQDALELGAADYLRKPFTMQALREKVERVKKRS